MRQRTLSPQRHLVNSQGVWTGNSSRARLEDGLRRPITMDAYASLCDGYQENCTVSRSDLGVKLY